MRGDRMLARARRLQAELMHSTCRITRNSGTTFNETTGEYQPAVTTVYEGKCDFRFDSSTFRMLDAQSQILTEQRPILKLPVTTSAAVRVGDVGELITHRHDTGLVGMRFRIASVHTKTHASARRLTVEVITSE